MSFFPIDRDLLSSSLWAQGSPEQVKVWLYLLLEADPRNGIVEDADPGIALRCGLPLDVTTKALDWLAAPDTFSRTKDHDGRRLERLPDGGVRLLNYVLHRDKDYSTPRVRAWRERKRRSTVTGTTDKDTDKDKDNNGERTESPVGDPTTAPTEPSFSKLATKDRPESDLERYLETFQQAFQRQRRAQANPKLLADFAARRREGWTAAQIVAAPFIEAQALFDRDDKAAREIRSECQPSHLLRDGKHARTTQGGFTAGATHRLAAAYDRAPQVELGPRLARAAREFGVWETLEAAGVTVEIEQ